MAHVQLLRVFHILVALEDEVPALSRLIVVRLPVDRDAAVRHTQADEWLVNDELVYGFVDDFMLVKVLSVDQLTVSTDFELKELQPLINDKHFVALVLPVIHRVELLRLLYVVVSHRVKLERHYCS